jgi:hypothetical protein
VLAHLAPLFFTLGALFTTCGYPSAGGCSSPVDNAGFDGYQARKPPRTAARAIKRNIERRMNCSFTGTDGIQTYTPFG